MPDPLFTLRPSRQPRRMEDYEYIRELVRRNSAIVLDETQDYLIEARLSPLAHDQGLKSVNDLISILRSENPGTAHGRVVEALTTNETRFFRDVQPFDVLKSKVLPELILRNSQSQNINIWSAACSTGQEAYSIAMTLLEHRGLSDFKHSILATDLNETVLDRARSGVYKQLEVNRGLPARCLIKHFTKTGAAWQVNRQLEEVCEFRKLNLINPWVGMPQFDIVFLRNVLIYFDVETKVDVLRRVARTMAPGAFLFLGAAETIMNTTNLFARAFDGTGGCYRRIKVQ